MDVCSATKERDLRPDARLRCNVKDLGVKKI